MQKKIKTTMIELLDGDITSLEVDAIVNAANSCLKHDGGVAGAILKKGGPSVQEESDLWVKIWGPVSPGQVAITGAGELPSKYIIHAVGPRMGEKDEDKKLRSATLMSLLMAQKRGLKTLAFPAISTGIFGYPMDKCARMMIQTAKQFIRENSGMDRIIFCLFGQQAFNTFKKYF